MDVPSKRQLEDAVDEFQRLRELAFGGGEEDAWAAVVAMHPTLLRMIVFQRAAWGEESRGFARDLGDEAPAAARTSSS